MSLRSLHILFILTSIVASALSGYWCFTESNVDRTLIGSLAILFAAALTVYCIYFIRKAPKLGETLSLAVGLPLASLLLDPSSAHACAVCYGDPDSPMAQGAVMGVVVLLGITGGVLFCFAYFIFSIWRRSRSLSAHANTESFKC